MATSQFQNRSRDVGRGNGSGTGNSVGDAASGGSSYWIAGMIFFGVVAFISLPISAVLLMRSEKLLAKTEAVLQENKKLKEAPKVKKEDE
jgi:hypothetical protein